MAINVPAQVSIKASVSGQSAVDGLKASVNGISQSTTTMADKFKTAAVALKALAATYIINQGLQFTKSILDTAESLRNLSQKTGIGVQALSELKTAGELNGVEFDNLQGALKKFSVNVSDASVGAGKANSAFAALGISVKGSNGQIKPTNDLLLEVADRFANLKDGPEKASIAVKLFGKSGADLIPLLDEGSDGLKKFGAAFTDDFADRAKGFNDTLKTIGVAIKDDFIQGLSTILPTLQEVANSLLQMFQQGKDGITFFEGLGEAIRLFAVVLDGAIADVADFIDFLASMSKAVYQGGKTIVDTVSNISAALMFGNKSLSEAATPDFSKATAAVNDYAARSEKRIAESSARMGALLKNSLLFGQGTTDEIRKRQQDDTAPEKRQASATPPPVADTAGLNKLLEVNEAQKSHIALIDADTQALFLNEDEKKRLVEVQKIDNAYRELEEKGVAGATEAHEKYRTALIASLDAQEAQRKSLANNPWVGAKRALDDYAKSAADVATQTQNAVTSSLKGLEDAFIDFFNKGKADWKAFANSVIEEIERILIRKAVLGPLAGLISGVIGSAFGGGTTSGTAVAGASSSGFSLGADLKFANGGIMTAQGSLPLNRYASGGIANSPQLAMFGEGRGPEAYVPLPDGRSIPVSMSGQGGAGTNVSVVVNMGKGDDTASSTNNSANGAQFGKLIGQMVKQEIIQQKRPGGLLAS